jgi:hypothetical protein
MQIEGKHTQISLVYAKETGKIVHNHQFMWMQGARLPTESQLRSSALALTVEHTEKPEPELDVLFISEELSPEKRYSVDVKEKRVIAS